MSQGILAASRSWKKILPNSLQKECNLPGGAWISVPWESWPMATIRNCKIDIFGIRASPVVQRSRIRLQCRGCRRRRFDPCMGKIPWRRAWQPTPVFLPGESHGQRRQAGYSSQDHKDSNMTEQLSLHSHLECIVVHLLKRWFMYLCIHQGRLHLCFTRTIRLLWDFVLKPLSQFSFFLDWFTSKVKLNSSKLRELKSC